MLARDVGARALNQARLVRRQNLAAFVGQHERDSLRRLTTDNSNVLCFTVKIADSHARAREFAGDPLSRGISLVPDLRGTPSTKTFRHG